MKTKSMALRAASCSRWRYLPRFLAGLWRRFRKSAHPQRIWRNSWCSTPCAALR
ncbi:MAG: hypothetical protein ACLR4A_07765 [Christensenellales bacterium]